MEISFIHTQILVHSHVNKTNFHMKVFALELALKQRRNANRKSPIRMIKKPMILCARNMLRSREERAERRKNIPKFLFVLFFDSQKNKI